MDGLGRLSDLHASLLLEYQTQQIILIIKKTTTGREGILRALTTQCFEKWVPFSKVGKTNREKEITDSSPENRKNSLFFHFKQI